MSIDTQVEFFKIDYTQIKKTHKYDGLGMVTLKNII